MFATVLKNTAYLLTYQILNKLLFTLLVIFIARWLGPTALGEYAFAFAFEYIIIFYLGVVSKDLVVRDLSGDKRLVPEVVGNMIAINMVLLLAALPAVLAVSNVLGRFSGAYVLVRLVWFDAFLASFTMVFTSVFRAYERMHHEAVMMSIQDLITVALSLLMVLKGFGVTHVILMFIAGKAASFMYASIIMMRCFPLPRFKVDFGLWRDLFRRSVPFFFNGLFLLIVFQVDILMLGVMKGDVDVGVYEAGYNIVRNIGLLSMVFIAAIFPPLSRLHKTDDKKLYRFYGRAFAYVLAFSLAVNAGIVALARPIISLLYGSLFSDAAGLLPLLAAGGFFLTMSALNSCLLNAITKEVKNVFFVGLASVLNVALNLALIPQFSYYGAAAATVATYAGLFIIQTAYIVKVMFWRG